MAKIAEQAQKYDEMFSFVKQMIETKSSDFTLDERAILAVSFRNYIDHDR